MVLATSGVILPEHLSIGPVSAAASVAVAATLEEVIEEVSVAGDDHVGPARRTNLASFFDAHTPDVYAEVMAKRGSTTMHQRVNVTLLEETIRLIDRSADHGNRSRFIDKAVKYFVREHGRTQLRRLLEEGAERRAARDLAIAEEWFPVDKDAWRKRRR